MIHARQIRPIGNGRRRPRTIAPAVEGVEARVVLSTPTGFTSAPAGMSHAAVIAPLNQRIVNFLQARIGIRLGGGECAQMATEALRVAGARFTNIGPDAPFAGDYTWGALVKGLVEWNGKIYDTHPTAAVQPGDIIQYRSVTFKDGSYAAHHTSVVAAVDASGRPTAVYQQNAGNGRFVSLAAVNFSTMTGGYVNIWRPVPRTSQPGVYNFTIVNNTPWHEVVSARFGTMTGTSFALPLTASNTAGSYSAYTLSWASSMAPTLVVNGQAVQVVDGAAYEVYTSGYGASIHRVNP
jgi:hypothetical protein